MSLTKEMLAIAAIVSVGLGVAQPASADNHATMPEAEAMTEEVMTEEVMTDEMTGDEVISQVDEAEPVTVSGTVVDIVGNRVRIRDAETEETTFYDIPRESQIEAGIEEGDVIEMVLVDDMVVAITGPGGEYVQIVAVDEDVTEETVTTTETETEVVEETVVEEPVAVEEETEMVETTETTAPVRALW